MNLGLTDKIIIVTGGAKGIGKGIVEVLAKEGAVPVIVGRSEADNNVTVGEIEGQVEKLLLLQQNYQTLPNAKGL
jgi:NAD(P)-dependent dehydrogenase (short-subunit alcohol dehydrogenase family)